MITHRITPFGNPGVNGYVLLTPAYRSLSRPSSPYSSKASTINLYSLDHIINSISGFFSPLNACGKLFIRSSSLSFTQGFSITFTSVFQKPFSLQKTSVSFLLHVKQQSYFQSLTDWRKKQSTHCVYTYTLFSFS